MTEEQKLQLFTLQRGHCLESSFMTDEKSFSYLPYMGTLSWELFCD